jgi:diguanylate cyclase (GGDEF)-like protein
MNRAGFEMALENAMRHVTSAAPIALFYLDIDRFKSINDGHGHGVGDRLLKAFAARLLESLRASDVVARLGGDEFVVMADGLANETLARELGLKLLDAFRAPFALGANVCNVSATVGYALAPADASDAGSLLKAADAAMYAGKQEGKDRLVRSGG